MFDNHFSCIKVSDTKICPHCYSSKIIKNGHTKTRKQQFYCKNCNKRFLDFYTHNAYKQNINEKIIQFTKEGLGIRSTARVLKISATTLLSRIIKIAKDIPRPVLSSGKSYEMDEIRFFVKNKKHTFWLVYAIDRETRQVANFYIGRRTNRTLRAVVKTLINSKPLKIFTDKLRNYQYLIPSKLHSTKRFSTNRIERKNLNIRTHLKRFSRRTICFSKSILMIFTVLKIYFWI
jgi:IS1 family transposase/transposase-like protein